MKKFSSPCMKKEYSLHPTPHTLHPFSSQISLFSIFETAVPSVVAADFQLVAISQIRLVV
jgi:hypothetical protein